MNAVSSQKPLGHGTLDVCHAEQLKWVPWAMKGAHFKLLSVDPQSGRFTLLIKIDQGVVAPVHRHVGAIEGYVLEGGFHYHDEPDIRFTAGSYLLEHAGEVHQPVSPEGAIMFAVFHGPVEGLDQDGCSIGSVDWQWHVDRWRAAGGSCEQPAIDAMSR